MGSTSFVPRAPGCENAAFVVERLEFACGLSAAFVAASRDDPSLNETAFVLSDGRARLAKHHVRDGSQRANQGKYHDDRNRVNCNRLQFLIHGSPRAVVPSAVQSMDMSIARN